MTHMNSIADNLPVATRLELFPNKEEGTEEEQRKDTLKDIQFEHGYRLGFTENNKVILKSIFSISNQPRDVDSEQFILLPLTQPVVIHYLFMDLDLITENCTN